MTHIFTFLLACWVCTGQGQITHLARHELQHRPKAEHHCLRRARRTASRTSLADMEQSCLKLRHGKPLRGLAQLLMMLNPVHLFIPSSLGACSPHTTSPLLSTRTALGCRVPMTVMGEDGKKRVVFLGTPECAEHSLKLLLQGAREGRGGGFEIVGVVSQPPDKKGKKLIPSPVQACAEAEGLNVVTPVSAKDEEFLTWLEELKPDLCITAAYGNFLPQRFLDLPVKGTLNIHPSLLPLYRGAAPIQRSLEAGDTLTGVTVAFTVLKMDAGPVLRQVERKLDGTEFGDELLIEMFGTGTELLLEALPSVWDGSCEEVLKSQDDERATKAPKIEKKEGEVRLDVLSAAEIHNRCRGFAAGPGIWTEVDKGDGKPPTRVKFYKTRLPDEPVAESGSRAIKLNGTSLMFTCADDSVLEVLQIVVAGKKPTDGKAFWNGLRGNEAKWVGSDAAKS
mmetsp:Transcript_47386/g.86737  ORF Transcript_47386/g.86737 Transcript_47386/m.86737 type:complete len:451 (-) Transcript_47386:27-1379(-)